MPHFPQQQHDTCSSSTGRRKHLNLLLFDQLDEIKRIYAGTGRMPTYTLGGRALRTAPAAIGGMGGRPASFWATQTLNEPMERPPPFRGPGPSLSQQALVLMRSSPRASYAGSYADSYAGSGAPSPHGSHYVPELEAVSVEPSPRMSVESLPPITQQEKSKPSWLLPWQTGDRELGRKMALCVKNARTPIGAFAQLELAKAVK